MNSANGNGRSPAMKIVRWVATIVVVAGILEGLLQTNVQKLAEQEGWDKVLADHWHPIMDRFGDFLSHQWTWNFVWFCAGVAAALWGIRLFPEKRRNGVGSTNVATRTSPLAYALHMSSAGMDVRIDQKKKAIQVGFNLQNSADIPLRYYVESISVIIDGKTVMNPAYTNRGGVIPKGGTQQFHFAPIPAALGKTAIKAEAAIIYRYGPAGADEPPVREANYRVELTIAKSGTCPYMILEENDGEI